MRDMERLLEKICEELDKIAEKGLNTGNLETAYKLIDMYKDLKNTEYWEVKEAYYMEDMGILGGYSEAVDVTAGEGIAALMVVCRQTTIWIVHTVVRAENIM